MARSRRCADATLDERNGAARFSPPPPPPPPLPPGLAPWPSTPLPPERERLCPASFPLAFGGDGLGGGASRPARIARARRTTHDSCTIGAYGHAPRTIEPASTPSGATISVTSCFEYLLFAPTTAAPSSCSRAISTSRD